MAEYAPTSKPPSIRAGLVFMTRKKYGENTEEASVKRRTAATEGTKASSSIFTQPKLLP